VNVREWGRAQWSSSLVAASSVVGFGVTVAGYDERRDEDPTFSGLVAAGKQQLCRAHDVNLAPRSARRKGDHASDVSRGTAVPTHPHCVIPHS
jgi:hypothetical protein